MLSLWGLTRVTPVPALSYQLNPDTYLYDPAWLAPAKSSDEPAFKDIPPQYWLGVRTGRCFDAGSAFHKMTTENITGYGKVPKATMIGDVYKVAVGYKRGLKAVFKGSAMQKVAVREFVDPDWRSEEGRHIQQQAGSSLGSDVIAFHLDCILGLHRTPPTIASTIMVSTLDHITPITGGPFRPGTPIKRNTGDLELPAVDQEEECGSNDSSETCASKAKEEKTQVEKHYSGDFPLAGTIQYFIKGLDEQRRDNGLRQGLKVLCFFAECPWDYIRSAGMSTHARFAFREDAAHELWAYLLGLPLNEERSAQEWITDRDFGKVTMHLRANGACQTKDCAQGKFTMTEKSYHSLVACKYHKRVVERLREVKSLDGETPLADTLRASLLRDPVILKTSQKCSAAGNTHTLWRQDTGFKFSSYSEPVDEEQVNEDANVGESECPILFQVEHILSGIDDRADVFLKHLERCIDALDEEEVYYA